MTSRDTTPRNCIEMSSTLDPLLSHLRVPHRYRIRYTLAFALASSNIQHSNNTVSPTIPIPILFSAPHHTLVPFSLPSAFYNREPRTERYPSCNLHRSQNRAYLSAVQIDFFREYPKLITLHICSRRFSDQKPATGFVN